MLHGQPPATGTAMTYVVIPNRTPARSPPISSYCVYVHSGEKQGAMANSRHHYCLALSRRFSLYTRRREHIFPLCFSTYASALHLHIYSASPAQLILHPPHEEKGTLPKRKIITPVLRCCIQSRFHPIPNIPIAPSRSQNRKGPPSLVQTFSQSSAKALDS